jgi:hypothetical protein
MPSPLRLTGLAGAAALAAAAAQAQPVAQPAAPRGDIAGFTGGPQALPRAIGRIERSAGGRVMEIRFDRRAGRPGYDAVVAKGPQLVFLRAEQDRRARVIAARAEPAWMLGWKGRKDVRIAERARVSLASAVRTAEASDHDAPAVAAGIATSASNPTSRVHAYNVLLEQGRGHTRRLAVDANTGQVISDPSALSYWP